LKNEGFYTFTLTVKKPRKFNLKYAIGEIFIVSIGILIAFGINTCSATLGKKSAYKEYKASLITDLNQNLENLNRIIKSQELKVKELKRVVSDIESNQFDTIALGAILFKQRKSPTFFPISGTFKSMVSHGDIELFSTPLKRELFNLYDATYERAVYNGNLYDKVFLNVYDIEIRDLMDFDTQEIQDYKKLKSKPFSKNIKFVIDEAESYIKLAYNCKNESEEMLKLIKAQ